jgi:hypothetical protein
MLMKQPIDRKPVSNFSLNTALLPSHADLSTAHWPTDQQNQFAAAVNGIRGTAWFQSGCAQMTEVDRERVALSFAFAAFASIRRRPDRELAEIEDLMKDNKGLGR